MNYFCCEEGRRSLVGQHLTLNAIDHLEVVDREQSIEDERQRLLRVWFVKPLDTPQGAALKNRFAGDEQANASLIKVDGGGPFRGVAVDRAKLVADHLEVHLTARGDYSRYTLRLVEPVSGQHLKELDPALAAVDFSFKVECESDFDCAPAVCTCPPASVSAPALDYLAKDYASFRQLMLDRLASVIPDWRERNPADLGVAVVELLAYIGDQLSYRQDAIATEAYLGTARRRVSLRRHARLLDYASGL